MRMGNRLYRVPFEHVCKQLKLEELGLLYLWLMPKTEQNLIGGEVGGGRGVKAAEGEGML